ncbi:MAG: hypothetical protein A3E80_03330 [Chlamydiae bacterium RIFCSPHIGHO2_12_FULL_49_9]|nr:MAG: hypothetical protein A3E80_03330 [Chlamydiae bacterium RIFCSPHIGHO2_12_FULL_49_9]
MAKNRKLPDRSVVLKGLRGREGLTQEDLAKKMKLSRSSISKIETGKKLISPEEAKKLAKALKTKPRMFDRD